MTHLDPCPNTRPQIQYSTMTVPMMMPASLKMATLLPDCAMRVRRVALPLRELEKVEKVSFYVGSRVVLLAGSFRGVGV